jgi:hypothetical protein
MKLTIELIPETVFYKNLRTALIDKGKQDIWDKIRHKAYSDANYTCSICGEKTDRLECHEIWEYDDKNSTQTLKGFHALCNWCHHCKHMGMANILHQQGKLDINKVISHFAKVNGLSIDQADSEIKKAFEVWHERSKKQWKQNLGEFAMSVIIK